MEYNSNNDLIKRINVEGNSFTYTYDSDHNVTDSETAEKVDYEFTYDSYGNNTSAKVYDNDGVTNQFIKSTATYISNDNYINIITDSRGSTTNFDYDANVGVLQEVEDANGDETRYDYHSKNDILTKAWHDANKDNLLNTGEIFNYYTYDNDNLERIYLPGFYYHFDYDGFGNITGVKKGISDLVSNTYDVRKDLLTNTTYGNNDTVGYAYDDLDRLTAKNFDGGTTPEFQYYYAANGLVGCLIDNEIDIEYDYIYDSVDRLGRIERSNGIFSWYQYDDIKDNNTIEKLFELDNYGREYCTEFEADKDGRSGNTTISKDNGTEYRKEYSYDALGRVTNIKYYTNDLSPEHTISYSYFAGGHGTNSTTSLIESVTYDGNITISYTYDAKGNIKSITQGGDLIQYYYDALGQLTRENNPYLGTNGQTIIYSYDKNANLTKKQYYNYTSGQGTPGTLLDTINYTYDSSWNDKLSSYDGHSITYDSIGNPLTYDGWTYTWKWGRRLATASKGTVSTSYKYNDNGIRTYKQVTDSGSTTTYKYNLMGSNITYEERTGANVCETYYAYDNNGKLYGFYYDGSSNDGFYFYKRNIQGDIIGILNSSGTEVVTYKYDTWGKLISTTGTKASTVGADNPFRYRGYYYDTETGLYYLNQRYYNPEWGRFINADDYMGQVGELLSHNLFAYCGNNPVNMADSSGRDADADYDYWQRYYERQGARKVIDKELQILHTDYIPGSVDNISEPIQYGGIPGANDIIEGVTELLAEALPPWAVNSVMLVLPEVPSCDYRLYRVSAEFIHSGREILIIELYEDGNVKTARSDYGIITTKW